MTSGQWDIGKMKFMQMNVGLLDSWTMGLLDNGTFGQWDIWNHGSLGSLDLGTMGAFQSVSNIWDVLGTYNILPTLCDHLEVHDLCSHKSASLAIPTQGRLNTVVCFS